MKLLLIVFFVFINCGYSQLGWEPYTGQPTQTLYGSVAGAGLGYMLASAISNGPDAQWIGALAGMAAGGLLANYMSGDNIQHQRQMQQGSGQQDGRVVNRQQVPNAINLGKGLYQSPYSEFVVSTADYKPGSIINDPLEGQLFRIPR